ncbi:ABC transporter permease [Puia sp. P3]|uniref:ABC transporter permease n=1 Tax=Puia sp. P3 TaxID=3423952 RepID=UPI003D66FBA0
MLKNYLRSAIRNIIRHRSYSAINISGLAIGMASSIFILLWVRNELSYDKFNTNADHIFRITADASGFKAAVNCAGMPSGLLAAIPDIRNAVRLSHRHTILLDAGNNRKFEEKNTFYADSTFLDIFSFSLIAGDRKTALLRHDAILLTATAAKKYFGTVNAIGHTLKKDNGSYVTVTGVLANIPSNSHLQFDCILPMSSIVAEDDDLKNNVYTNFNFYSYVLLNPQSATTPAALTKLGQQADQVYQQHVPRNQFKVNFQFQPLTSIHLDTPLQVDFPGHGNRQYVNVFFIVAIVILLVACINFMNLATARSARRAKEVGLRKVVGALRGQIVRQFLGEALLISFLALLLAIGLVWSLLPLFNDLAQKDLRLNLTDGYLLLGLLAITLLTGFLAGSYPALFLSGFRPAKVLKGNLAAATGAPLFRNALVVVQFVVSIVLLAGTFAVYNQLNFIRSRNMGFDKENLLYVPMTGEIWGKQKALRTELLQNPLTSNYAIVSEIPINIISGHLNTQWEGKDPHSQIVIPSLDISESFISLFHMKIISGRDFSTSFRADSSNFIINETAARIMNQTAASVIGKPFTMDDIKGTIIGVVKDFNFKPIHQTIEPLVMRLNNWGGNIVVRAQAGKTEATIKAMEKIYHTLNPAYPFNYNFLDQDLASQYKGEQQMGNIFKLFAFLAIFISGLGLYGLSAFMAQQRTREISVRKVLGASTFNIVYLLTTGFTRLILIAVVISVPLSLFAIQQWLESFAYHVQIGWPVYFLSSAAALFLAWLTVSFETIKAAFTNPAHSLRSE